MGARVGEDASDLGARVAVPLDGFDRAAVLLGLESIAGAAGDPALAARARDARGPDAASSPSRPRTSAATPPCRARSTRSA